MQQKQNKQNKRISPNLTATIGTIVIMIGGFFLSYNYIQTMKKNAYDFMADSIYIEKDNTSTIEVEQKEKKEEEKPETSITNDQVEKYLGYLVIPKINLKRGFFSIDSNQNNVEKNIYIVKGSSYPDIENGNFIIAAHSGTGWKAFFNDLYKLEKEDIVSVEYNNKKYNYKITKKYKQEKTGKIAIYRNYDKTTLTLVTCTNNDSKTQTIYIAELENIE